MNGQPKLALRESLRARRRAIAAARDRDADGRALAGHGRALLEALGVGAGDCVSAYVARTFEPPTAALIQALQGAGVRVLVPITLPDFDLDWADAADRTQTPLGRGAIGDAALVFVPALAVDLAGTRLGKGGGCYDRALPRRAPGVLVVALLHPGERPTDPLPREVHDLPVDAVLTASGVSFVAPADDALAAHKHLAGRKHTVSGSG